MNIGNLLCRAVLTFALALSLAGCGGGDPTEPVVKSDPEGAFDSSAFQGNWKRTDGTASGNPANCFVFNDYGGNYGGLNRPLYVTANTLTTTVEVYSDLTCTKFLGLMIINYSVQWSAGSIPGKSIVAKVLATSTGYWMNNDGGPGYSIISSPATGIVSRGVFHVEGNLMYTGNPNGPLDSSGYPLTLRTPAFYTR